MGSMLSILGYGDGNGDGTPDPITGLTNKENKLIQSSFNKIMENSIENGMNIMMKLFEKGPQYKKMFSFRDVPDDELRSNVMFKVHCNRIMYNLREIVDNLGDSDLVMGMLEKLATNHIKHGAPAQGFQDVKIVFLEILAGLFSSETVEAWKKLLDMAFGYVSKQLS